MGQGRLQVNSRLGFKRPIWNYMLVDQGYAPQLVTLIFLKKVVPSGISFK